MLMKILSLAEYRVPDIIFSPEIRLLFQNFDLLVQASKNLISYHHSMTICVAKYLTCINFNITDSSLFLVHIPSLPPGCGPLCS